MSLLSEEEGYILFYLARAEVIRQETILGQSSPFISL